MLFATAKKDYGEPWCEQELAARDKFIAEWSNVDFSDGGNTAAGDNPGSPQRTVPAMVQAAV